MLNNTFQRANPSPLNQYAQYYVSGSNKTMTEAFIQCLYSSEQRWEGMIAEVYQFCFPRGEPVHIMQRANSLLVLHLQGVVDLQRQNDGHTEQGRFYKGSINLEPPEAPPTFFCQETLETVLTLGLVPSLFEQAVAEMGRYDPTHVEIIKQFNLHDPLIEQIGLALVAELEAGGVAGRVYAESLAHTLVLHLLRLSSTASLLPPPSSQRNLTQRQIAIVEDYIYDRLDQDIALRDLAASLDMSVSYFCRLFKQSTGQAPHQYVITRRVERAKELLLKEERTIAQVAHAVGFADQSHLNRHFKRLIGISPGMLCKQSKNVQE
jgi:AraC family transcriptional regulator